MRRILLAAAIGTSLAGSAGIGHNMPPVLLSQTPSNNQGILPRRVVDENRRNQKLKQKLRRVKRLQALHAHTRAQRKDRKFGPGYRPGKLFKGHRM